MLASFKLFSTVRVHLCLGPLDRQQLAIRPDYINNVDDDDNDNDVTDES